MKNITCYVMYEYTALASIHYKKLQIYSNL